MIKITNLIKSYKGKCVVADLSFEVGEGEVFALLGSNGAGKSTTIKMILGLVKKDGGEIEIDKNEGIGYSPETPFFPPFLTGKEVIVYYGKLQGLNREEVNNIAIKLLKKVGLEDDRTKVKNYSKGMLQRLALAQALLGEPDFLILDEPCAGLDAMGRMEMLDIIRKLKESGKTIIMNSHILSDIEKVCDRGIIMNKGKVLLHWSSGDFEDGCSLEEIFIKSVGCETEI